MPASDSESQAKGLVPHLVQHALLSALAGAARRGDAEVLKPLARHLYAHFQRS